MTKIRVCCRQKVSNGSIFSIVEDKKNRKVQTFFVKIQEANTNTPGFPTQGCQEENLAQTAHLDGTFV